MERKIKQSEMDFAHIMASIGPIIEESVRSGIDDKFQTESGIGYSEYLDIRMTPAGAHFFTLTVTSKGGGAKGYDVGRGLLEGRPGGVTILPKNAKVMVNRTTGQTYRRVTQGAVEGMKDEARQIARKSTRRILRWEISKRTGLGPLGGGSVTRGI
jgi:hypothetical protein